MWTPTHVQVTVHRARNLLAKGKGGTNDAYVTIQINKEKYQTSVKDKSRDPEWHEECDLQIPDQSAVVELTVNHRNLLGLDAFLGHLSIPLDQFQIYERPRSRWYPLRNKPGSKKTQKDRGEIEVKVTFIVQSLSSSTLSLSKLGKVKKSPSIKNLAHNVGDKLHIKFPSKSNLFKSGSKTELKSSTKDHLVTQSPKFFAKAYQYDDKPESPQSRRYSSTHDGLPTVYKAQEILPTDYKPPDTGDAAEPDDYENSSQGSSFQDNRSSTEDLTPADRGLYRGSPRLTAPPKKPPRSKRFSTTRGLSRSTYEISGAKPPESPKMCRTIEPENYFLRPTAAQSMLDLSTPAILEPPATQAFTPSPHVRSRHTHKEHRHSETEVKKSGSDAEDDEEFTAFKRSQPAYKSLPTKRNSDNDLPERNGKETFENMDSLTASTTSERTLSLASLPEEDSSQQLSPVDEKSESELFSQEVMGVREPPPPSPQEKHDEQKEESQYKASPQLQYKVSPQLPRTPIPETTVTVVKDSYQDEPKKETFKISRDEERSKRRNLVAAEVPKEKEDDMRLKVQKSADSGKRHTLQYGHKPRASTFELHEIHEYKKSRDQETARRECALSQEVLDQYQDMTREDLIKTIIQQKGQMQKKDAYNRDLEDYIDNLLVKVMESTPKILQNPKEKQAGGRHNMAFSVTQTNKPPAPQSYSAPTSVPLSVSSFSSPPPQNNKDVIKISSSTKAMNANNIKKQGMNTRNHKKSIPNPFKKISAALK